MDSAVLSSLSSTSIWVILAIIFAFIEAVTLGIASIWFVFGALAAALFSFIGFGPAVQIAVFIIVSAVLLILTRPILVDKFNLGKEKTNVDAIIGQEGIVEEEIDNIRGKGQVMIKGHMWSARSADSESIKKGRRVTVQDVEGVKVIVKEVPREAAE